jgi:hypothetical protein
VDLFFWTLPVDRHALRTRRDGRRAVIEFRDLPVLDSFQFFGPNQTPASISFRIEWTASGAFADRGSGAEVPATDPAAFRGRIAEAGSTARFWGSEYGFRFRSDPGVTTQGRGFAMLGRTRNGRFL